MSARGLLVLLLLALVGGAGVLAWLRFEGSAPVIEGPDRVLVGGGGADLRYTVSDEGSGLRVVSAVLTTPAGEETLALEERPGTLLRGGATLAEPLDLAFTLDVSALPRTLTEAQLRVAARDWSLRGAFSGNETVLEIPVTIDRKPPRISVATGLSYVHRGGTGVVVYSVSEDAERDGVQVAERLFPGYPMGDRRVAFYAVAADAPEKPAIRVVAEDAAGNRGSAGWPVVVKERAMPVADVNLPGSFLQNVVPALAENAGVEATDPAATFHLINSELRERNEAQIRESLAASAAERLWQGAFAQLANSQVTSRFAEQRTYKVDGTPVSNATHYGYDLASTAAAPITSAARGRVVYADDLGIYGNCVLVDHGLGVGSLYGHLSRMDVAAGDAVEKGQQLGLSGATGLAGGDHLHFAVMVSGVYVDPLEWWDPKWMATSVDARMGAAQPAPAP